MSDTTLPSSKTWCQAVRSKFNFLQRKNDKIIKDQKKMIETQDLEISQSKQECSSHSEQNELLRKELEEMKQKVENVNIEKEDLKETYTNLVNKYSTVVATHKEIQTIANQEIKAYEKTVDILERKLEYAINLIVIARISDYRRTDKVEQQEKLIQSLRHQLILMNNNEDVQNFPDDMFERLCKPEMNTEQILDDEMFHKELAKRMTCKICVSDVKRLRCSTCLKGICQGCHEKVASCPHCRNEKTNFKPIIMARL